MTSPIIPNDPFGDIKRPKKEPIGVTSPKEVNDFHTKSDVDSSKLAQHHTLGIKRNQGATGEHTHDGNNSRKIGTGANLTVTGKITPTTVAEVDAIIDSLFTQLSKVIALIDGRT